MRFAITPARGLELARATALVPSGARSNTAYADITGLTLSFVGRERPVALRFRHPFFQVGNAGAFGDIAICDSVDTVLAAGPMYAAAAAAWDMVTGEAIVDVVAGTSYTFKLRSRVSAGSYGLGSAAFAFNTVFQAIEV
jgi:hypothetical protein